MPSPFPGMDPYLEHPDLSPGLHGSLIVYLKAALQHVLPQGYYADSNERGWLEVSDCPVRPGVGVLRREKEDDASGPRGSAGTSTLPATLPVLVSVSVEERREDFLEIYARQGEEERLVTAIEVLSPTNKASGSDRRGEYLKKQREMILGRVHLVEVDLLRGGRHTTAVPRERAVEKAGEFHYHVCVHRFDRRGDFFVYPIRLAERLPAIEIPLLPEDGAVRVDLEDVFTRAYDDGPYRKRVRYGTDEIVPPLTAQEAEWARQQLPR
ncbi:MAG: DUF4058 family protein [Planctomycetes bacterium]|nr:DUF4058 family protein [Planctomycetota bacterium]